jgi:hypothetical protein
MRLQIPFYYLSWWANAYFNTASLMSCWGWQLGLSGMRDRFGIFGAVIRIRKLSLLLVVMLRMPNSHHTLQIPRQTTGKILLLVILPLFVVFSMIYQKCLMSSVRYTSVHVKVISRRGVNGFHCTWTSKPIPSCDVYFCAPMTLILGMSPPSALIFHLGLLIRVVVMQYTRKSRWKKDSPLKVMVWYSFCQ